MSSHTAFRAMLMASVLGFGSFGAQAAVSNTFDLTDQWAVSPANVGGSHDPQEAMPCILANQYDNGFKIRFTGGQDQILMMAVDFKQNIFTPGQAYPTAIEVGSMISASSGTAFNASTLLFNVRDLNGFTDAMKSAQAMTLNVQGNPMRFSLGQIQPALERMNTCAAKEQDKVIEAAAEPVAIKPQPVMEARAKPLAPDEESIEETKEREVYVRRRVKPMDMQAEQDMASVETASGEVVAQMDGEGQPEPIDLLKKAEPEKAVAIAPAKSSLDDAPVLVSRRDESMTLELPKQDMRPTEMALFDAQKQQAEVQQKPLEPIVQSEVIAPVVPTSKPMPAVEEKPAPVDVPIQKPVQIAAANTVEGDDFLQQSLKSAEEEIQKTSIDAPVTKTPMPTPNAYEPISSPEPYEPIKAQPIPKEPVQQEVAEVSAEPVTEEPQQTAATTKPKSIMSPGIKIVEPQPVALVRQAQVSPEWAAPKDIPKRKAEMPAIEDVLDAEEEAVIPIRTVRSKDIFVSREVSDEPEQAAMSAPTQSEPVAPKTENWSAKSGEDVKIVLARWAERAGTDLVWEADRGGQLVNDVSVSGSFEQAVQTLMAQNGDALGLNGAFDGMAQPAQTPISLISTQKAVQHGSSDQSTLRPFLENLSKQEDFKLVWNAQRDFILKNPVNPNGQFEDVLRTALEQYNADQIRPVGQLNINPETGERILVIDSERSL